MTELRLISGVGDKTIKLLNKLDVKSVEDLVMYYPKRYDVVKRTDMNLVNDGDRVCIDGIVEGRPMVMNISGHLKKYTFRISNDVGIYNINVFNQSYVCKNLRCGNWVTILGKYNRLQNVVVASEIRNSKLGDATSVEPVYYLTEGISNKGLSKLIKGALEVSWEIRDYIPDYLQERYYFLAKRVAIKEMHLPSSTLLYKKACQRLKYEELFDYLVKIHYFKKKRQLSDAQAIKRKIDEELVEEFILGLPFKLTKDQGAVIQVIKEDLLASKRMNRLVQGDVGSGKTIVAFVAGYINYLGGYQTAFMVPTEILAMQHYQNALKLFVGTGIKIGLITSSVKKREKDKLYEAIANGEVDLIIGTQALIQEKIRYGNLGLIITDEQHRFGVNQRECLKNKGSFVDVLSMSATPIPRTYALTIYGDMDVSSIKTKPEGRREVITYSVGYKDITRILKLMRRELDMGHQVYVIAPAISSDDGVDDLGNVVNLKEKMYLAFGAAVRIEAIHGKMDILDKNRVMKEFEGGQVNILISTTVIEVGVNVPNASMIVIFKANLFGLSTLHQLRGRVGRGDIQSYCVLLSDNEMERLKMLEKCNDGFLISEYDFKCRGEGDLFGVKQSGGVTFRLADIKRDFELLVRVRDDVLEFLDKYLFLEQYGDYRQYLDNFDSVD